MITLKNVEKAYKTGAGMTYVLRRISAEIKSGEFVTIMGPSGAGKTTLLSILGMLDDLWTGEYWFLDNPVHQMDRKKRSELNRKYIGFVFQSYHLLDNLTVYEHLDVPLSYRDVPRKQRASSGSRSSAATRASSSASRLARRSGRPKPRFASTERWGKSAPSCGT